MVFSLTVSVLFVSGCAQLHEPANVEPDPEPAQVVVVAPVLNLSNSTDWDPLKVTDILASEFQSFPGIVVIPVNRTLAALALRGKSTVETAEDALELAREFQADATVVAAITEYDPYDPPRVGIVMQWYATDQRRGTTEFDPVVASRQAADVSLAGSEGYRAGAAPILQVQQVYNAAENAVQADIRAFAASRRGYRSAYGAQIHTKSQELFLRYCCWASIRTMVLERTPSQTAREAAEARQWSQVGDVCVWRKVGKATSSGTCPAGSQHCWQRCWSTPSGRTSISTSSMPPCSATRWGRGSGIQRNVASRFSHEGFAKGGISPCTDFRILKNKVVIF
jgi:hypothetical protein